MIRLTDAEAGAFKDSVKGILFLILYASMGIDRAARKFTEAAVAAREVPVQGHVAWQSSAHSAFWRLEYPENRVVVLQMPSYEVGATQESALPCHP